MLLKFSSVLVSLVLALGIPLLAGFYVYRDASRRGMHALLWALVAAFAPAMTGLIVYLLLRGATVDLACPTCAAPVEAQYTACPHCGTRLRPTCPHCGEAADADWAVCPHCAKPLDTAAQDFQSPVRRKDKLLAWVLPVLLCAAVLLIVLVMLVSGLVVKDSSSTRVTGVTSLTIEDYLNEYVDAQNSAQVSAWLQTCTDPDTAYALEDDQFNYLVFVPNLSPLPECRIRSSLSLYLSDDEGGDGALLVVSYSGDETPKLRVYRDEQKMKLQTQRVDFPLQPARDEMLLSSTEGQTAAIATEQTVLSVPAPSAP